MIGHRAQHFESSKETLYPLEAIMAIVQKVDLTEECLNNGLEFCRMETETVILECSALGLDKWGDGTCVSRQSVCNEVLDCPDGQDEKGCDTDCIWHGPTNGQR